MKYSRLIFGLIILFFFLFVSQTIWAQPPPDDNGGGGGTYVGPISGGELMLLLAGVVYGINRYIKPFRSKK